MFLSYCTCPDQQNAEQIAQALVEKQIAACVNILPQVRSVYRWQGNVESTVECLLLIKTNELALEPLKEAITNLHPYDCPELISVEVTTGLPEYLSWVASNSWAAK